MKTGFIKYLDYKYKFNYKNCELTTSDYGKECILEDIIIESKKRPTNFYIGEELFENQKLVFYKRAGFPQISNIQKHHINMMIAFDKFKNESIKTIEISFKELTYFYGKDNFIAEYTEGTNTEIKGTYRLKSNTYSKTDSDEFYIIIDGKKIKYQIIVDRKLHIRKLDRANIFDMNTYIQFYYDFDEDYELIYKIILYLKKLFSYLNYRKNISFDKIITKTLYDDNLYVKNGEIEFYYGDDVIMPSDEEELKKHFIGFKYVKNNLSNIFQDIIDEKIFIRNMPYNQFKRNQVSADRVVMVTSALEKEFKLSFPKGIIHKKETRDARKKIDDLFEILKRDSEFNSDERKILIDAQKAIYFESLETLINQCYKSNKKVIDIFGKRLADINGLEYKPTNWIKAYSKLRNGFAHGEVNLDYSNDSMLGVLYTERLIYIMQLRRTGLNEKEIIGALNNLFERFLTD
ncbi:MAG: hypothetical protein RSA91_06335 [Bacilli bacterium]